jgi:3-methyladenine DNA glycosylase/8-oxoguanine DNA glycosylase
VSPVDLRALRAFLMAHTVAGLDTVEHLVGLDVDPSAGVSALAEGPVLGPLVRARPHLCVSGAADPLETAVLVVLGQHVSLAAGRRLAARLVASVGWGAQTAATGSRS